MPQNIEVSSVNPILTGDAGAGITINNLIVIINNLNAQIATMFDISTATSGSVIDAAAPAVTFPWGAAWGPADIPGPGALERRAIVKFDNPLASIRCTNLSQVAADLVAVAGPGGVIGIQMTFDPIIADFDPATVTWANQGGLTYGAAQIGAIALDAIVGGQQVFPIMLQVLSQTSISYAPNKCYGFRLTADILPHAGLTASIWSVALALNRIQVVGRK